MGGPSVGGTDELFEMALLISDLGLLDNHDGTTSMTSTVVTHTS